MTADRPTVREYRSGDGDGLRELWLEAGFRLIGDDDPGLERFAARNPGLFWVAADAHGRVIGSVMGAWDGRRGWLYHVAVATGHRRTGLATDLVHRAETGLRALGCRRVLVLVEASNTAAHAFWHARGYARRDTHQLARSLDP